jgi:hypothetical protein
MMNEEQLSPQMFMPAETGIIHIAGVNISPDTFKIQTVFTKQRD